MLEAFILKINIMQESQILVTLFGNFYYLWAV